MDATFLYTQSIAPLKLKKEIPRLTQWNLKLRRSRIHSHRCFSDLKGGGQVPIAQVLHATRNFAELHISLREVCRGIVIYIRRGAWGEEAVTPLSESHRVPNCVGNDSAGIFRRTCSQIFLLRVPLDSIIMLIRRAPTTQIFLICTREYPSLTRSASPRTRIKNCTQQNTRHWMPRSAGSSSRFATRLSGRIFIIITETLLEPAGFSYATRERFCSE